MFEALRQPKTGYIRAERVQPTRSWLYAFCWLLVLLAGLLVADVVSLRLRPTQDYLLDVGYWGDQDVLRGVYAQEQDATGQTYRWTEAESGFFVQQFAVAQNPSLTLNVGGLPQSAGDHRVVGVALDTTDLALPVIAAARNYHMLLPPNALADGNLRIDITSAATVDPPDERAVAFRLDDLTISWPKQQFARPTFAMLLAQAAIVLVWVGIAWRLELPRWSLALVALAAISLLAWSTGYKLMMAMAWQMRLLFHSALVLACVWNAYPLLERCFPRLMTRSDMRRLLCITVIALGVRVLVGMFPPFGSHDLYIHRERLLDVQSGTLQLFDRPSEFGGQQTTVPPAFYMLVSPFTLLTRDPGVAIQGLYIFLEGTSALLIALVVLQLGGRVRAAMAAAIVAAALPIQMTILWWGFGPQIVSQWLLLLLLVLLTRSGDKPRWFWIGATLILTIALLTHNGAVVLGGSALAGYIALVWLFQPRYRREALHWGNVLLVSSAIAVLLLYGDVLISQLVSVQTGSTVVEQSDDTWARIGRVWDGLRSSFRPFGYVATIISLGLVIWRARAPYRWLVIAWLGSASLFLVVDLVLGLQVRYAYFSVPLLCAGLGFAIDWLMQQRVWGKLAGSAIVLFVCVMGIQLLLSGVFQGIKPTLTALTH